MKLHGNYVAADMPDIDELDELLRICLGLDAHFISWESLTQHTNVWAHAATYNARVSNANTTLHGTAPTRAAKQ